MPTDSLVADIQSELKKWSVNTRVYGSLYVGIRSCLIIASALVATRDSLSTSVAPFLSGWVPILALLVTILTAIDTWMKPRDKWRGFMEDRDALDDLRLRVESAATPAMDALRTEFASLRKRHREKNVY
ncbi:MAG TPA: hypothetical protein VJN39_07490 [Gemmatimonadales bacterium]|nr:hypothetical protein [Gemmatimonadales bacterium]